MSALKVLFGIACFVAVFVLGTQAANASFLHQSFTNTPSTKVAGGHPTVTAFLDTDVVNADSTNDDLKAIQFDFPAGLLGNPNAATTKCSDSKLSSNTCPDASVIGTIETRMRVNKSSTYISTPGTMYMMETPSTTPNAPLAIGIVLRPPGYRWFTMKSLMTGLVGVRTDDYGVTLTIDAIPREVSTTFGIKFPITYDNLKFIFQSKANKGKTGPYFTYAPTQCSTPLKTKVKTTSYASTPDVRTSESSYTATNCNTVPFTPTGSAGPTSLSANTTVGWTATYNVNTTPTTTETGQQQSHVKKTTVDLPVGTGLDFPAIGAIPGVCSEPQFVSDTCPANSKIGNASTAVPLLPTVTGGNFKGDIYLMGRQNGIQFGFIMRGPNSIKAYLKGDVTVVDVDNNGSADLVRATADNLPQAPWSTSTLNFTTPMAVNPGCGPGSVKSVLNGWSGASATITNNVTFVAPPGGSCGVVNQPPNLTIVAPVNGSTTSATTTILDYTVSDDTTPVGSIACNKADLSPQSLVVGLNTISVTCTDAQSASTTRSVQVTRVADNPPTVTMSSPAANSFTQSTSASAAWTVTDDFDPNPTCIVSVNGTAVSTPAAPHTSPTTVSLDPGVNNVSVSCNDSAGNSGNASRTVTRDNAGPTVTISAPTDGSTVPSGTTSTNATWSATDNFDPTPANNCTVSNNGVAVSGAPHTSPRSVTLSPGANAIRVVCLDEAGNSGEDTNTITVLGPIPTVAITSPGNGTWTTDSARDVTFTVNGSTSIPAGITCTATRNGSSLGAISSTTFNVGLANGANTIVVSCTSSGGTGNSTPTPFVINRDNGAPTPTITSPADGLSLPVGTSSISVAWTVIDDLDPTPANNCTVSVNGTNVTTPAPPHTSPLTVNLVTGTNAIRVTCADEAGNTGSDVNTVTVAAPPVPTVAITSPATGVWTTSGTQTVTFTVNGVSSIPAGTTCVRTINGGSSAAATTNSISVPLVNGANAIVVSCTNVTGTGNSTPVVVNRDNAAPVPTISSPNDGATFPNGTASTSVSFTVTDDLDPTPASNCTVRNNGTAVAGAPHGSPTTVSLVTGANAISVTCLDEAGNSGADTNTVTVFNPIPTVNITSPATGIWTTSATQAVTFQVNGSSTIPGGVTCGYTVNGGASTATSSTTIAAVPLGNAANSIVVSCTSNGGTGNSAPVVVNRDNAAPVPTIGSPADGATFPAGTASTSVSWTVIDNLDPSPENNCTVRNNGTAVAGAPHSSPITVPLVSGTNAISVTCLDEAGNSGADTNTVTVLGSIPVVNITSPATGIWTTSATQAVTFQVNGSSTIPGGVTCGYTVNGGASTATSSTTIAAVPLGNAGNSIVVSCTSSGGTGNSAPVVVNRDNAAPVPTIASPNDGATFPNGTASVSVSFGVTDNLDPTPASNCTVRNNGTAVAGAPHGSPTTVSLVTGANAISVTCLDEAGNSGADTNTVTVFNPIPTVNITSPATGIWTTSATQAVTFQVNGSSTIPGGVTCGYTVNGGASTATSSTTIAAVPLGNAANSIVVSCTSNGGTGNSAPVVVNRDNGLPTVTISAPANNTWTSSTSIQVSWGVTDVLDPTPANNCTVRNNGTPAPSAPHGSPLSVTLSNGVNTIQVTCLDEAGNSASDSRTVTRDNANPAVTISAPADGGTFPNGTASTSVTWNVTDDLDPTPANNCTLRNNGVAVTSPAAPHTSPTTVPLVSGTNAISVTCLDEALNSGADTNTVTVLSAVPAVNITSPANGSWTTSSSTAVTFQVNGSSTIPAGITCAYTVNGGASTATATTTIASVPLGNAGNSIVVSCTSSGGTGNSPAVVVNRDNAVPTVTITAPAAGLTQSAATVSVQWGVTDNLDPTPANNCTVSVNGVAITSPAAPHTTPITVGLVADQSNTILVSCADEAGNTGSATRTITRDTTAPVPTISSPADGATLAVGTTSVSVAWGVTDNLDATPASNCTVSNNGVNVTSPAAPHSTPTTVPVSIGSNAIRVTCLDEAGNSGQDTNTVTVPAPPVPVVAITSTNNSWQSAATANVAYTVNGSTTVPAGITCTATRNGTSIGSTTASPLAVSGLVEGANTIVISCTNAGGTGTSTPAPFTINRDTGLPTVTISSPNDGASLPIGTTSTSVSWGVTDALDPTPANNCTVAVNGVNVAGAPHNSPLTVPVSNGSNAIRVTCVDEAGNSGQDINTVTVPLPPAPTVAITSANNTWTTNASENVAYTVNGSTTVPAGITCSATRNGTSLGSTTASPLVASGLVSGANTIVISCTNAGGTGTSTPAPFTINRDNVAPAVTISAPADGSSGPNGTTSVSVAWGVTDALDPTPANNCTLRNNGVVVTSPAAPHTSPVTIPVVTGANAISVTCLDEAGNSGSDTNTYTRLDPIPTVAITSPATGIWTQSATQAVTFNVNGSGTIPAGVTCAYTVNGGASTATASTTIAAVPLGNAANSIVVSCTSNGGTGNSAPVVVNRDNAAPVPTISSPADGATLAVGATSVSVTWSATDNLDPTPTNNCTVSNNGVNVTSPAAPHSSPITVPVSNGSNAIRVTCLDEAGNSGQDTNTVTVPLAPVPNVVITSTNNTWTQSSTQNVAYTVNGSTTVPAGITCTATRNGTSIGSTTGSPLSVGLVNGANSVVISCTSSGGTGNSTPSPFTINRDNTAPVPTITSPADGATLAVGATTTSVSWGATDDLDPTPVNNCTVAVNGVNVAGAPHTSPLTVPVSNGSNAIRVTCVDEALNSGQDINTVTVPLPPAPTVAITSTNNTWTTSASQNVAYTVNGSTTVPGGITCSATRNGSSLGSTTASPLVVTGLVEGANTIVISCTNAGGTGTSTPAPFTINRDTAAPTVTISSPNDGTSLPTGTTSTSVTWGVTDALDPTPASSCTLSNNGVNVTSPAAPHTSPTTVPLVEGINAITVTCLDEAGNSGADTNTVTVPGGPLPDTTITSFANPSYGVPASGPAAPALTVDATGTESPTSYQCRVDGNAFTTCTLPWTVPVAGLTSPANHTYDVRAVNATGPDPSPARGHFWNDNRVFNAIPTVTAQPNSLTSAADVMRAGAHPNISATLTVQGYDDGQTVDVRFPDGLMGSLSSVPVASRCSLTQANAGTCPLSSKIGVLSGTATNPRDGDLTASGDLFLVDSADPAIPSDSAAGVALEMTAPNGLGKIRGLGYVKVPFSVNNDGSRNVTMNITSVPRSTVESPSETRPSALRFHVKDVQLTVYGDTRPAGANPNAALITNPHYCGTTFTNAQWARPNMKKFVGGGTGYNGSTVANVTADYEVTCGTQAFTPTLTMSTNPTTAESPTRLIAEFTLPPEAAGVPNATIGRAVAQLPPHLSVYFPGIGSSSQQCNVSTVKPSSDLATYNGYTYFNRGAVSSAGCPTTAWVGTATITTPILPTDLIGRIYLINASPIPYIGIMIDSLASASNPKGVTAGLFARTSLSPYINQPARSAITMSLDSIPDLPVTRLRLDIGDRTTRGTLGQYVLVNASPTDPTCVPYPELPPDDGGTPGDPSDDILGHPADPTPSAKAITRMRPWGNIASDAFMPWGATPNNLLSNYNPATDTELQNDLPVTDCTGPIG